MTNKEKLILEDKFGIYESENDFELETWTNGGVNMFIYLNKNEDITQQFREYVENFDIDEEIEIHRQGKDYRNAFSITESVDDFRDYLRWLQTILSILEEKEVLENDVSS